MTTAERLRTYVGDRQVDREAISSLFARYWEIGLFATMMGIAFGMRLWGLGDRAIHHDEALHMIYAHQIFEARTQVSADGISTIYEHVPFMHGPFKYFATAAMFRLFGDNDTTGRLVYALSGSILVGLPYFLRAYIGRYGAIIAALLLAFSPTLLYFSRFNRDDLLITTYTLGMVIVMWRYLKEEKQFLLYFVPALLTLGFMTMESTFITTAMLLAYLDIMLANDLIDQMRASRKTMTPQQVALAYIILIPTAWLVAAFWPLIGRWREQFSLGDRLPATGSFLVIMGTFALPQFAAAVQKVPFVPGLGDADVYDADDEHRLMMVVTFLFIAGSAAVGLMWNRKVWAIGAAIFYIPFFLLYTTFFTNGGDIWNPTTSGHFWTGEGGFWTGIWGSLDYWLSQQLVRRGSQPDYYYLMTLPVYEFLPLMFALGGTLYYAFRGKVEDKLLSAAALLAIIVFLAIPDSWGILGEMRIQAAFLIAIGATLLLTMDGFTKFLIFWSLAMLFGITVAGEKMPWLTVHLALPIALLSAKIMDDILTWAAPAVTSGAKRKTVRTEEASGATSAQLDWQRLVPFAAATGLGVAATLVFIFGGLQSGISVLAWLLAIAATAIVVWVARNYDWRVAGQVAAVALFMSLFVFTVRAGVTAAYDEGAPDGAPEEMLIYAQGSPKLDVIFEQIENFGQESGRGNAQPVLIDNTENIWPWPWYFRDHTALSYTEFQEGFTVPEDAVILVSQANQAKLEPYLEDYQAPVPYEHMWWFPQDYLGLEVGSFVGGVLSGDYWSLWAKYFIDRELEGNSVGAGMLAYFPKDANIDELPLPQGAVEKELLPETSKTVIGSIGSEQGQFNQPADVAVDVDGNVFVVDTLNHRVQKFSPAGQFIAAVGAVGVEDGQFANPFTAETYEVNDGPWGIGVDPQGNVFVADTWNHRIQVFDNDLKFVRSFGTGELFGPRDVVIDAAGNVLVVDTGNKRIAVYSATGELTASHGIAGDGQGQFNEPTSISIAPNGEIYVADYWNQRVQHFDANFAYIDEIQVESWGSQGVTDRAYLVALENGRVLITDPQNGRVAVFGPDGAELSSWALTAGATRPVGVTVVEQSQADAGTAYISDGLASNLVKVPLQQLTAPPAPATQ
jgi:predicted membrane-bound mannosyltransferase/streptogramin lyase